MIFTKEILNERQFFVQRALNDTSVDVEASFQAFPEVEFILALCVHITLAADTEAESTYFPLLFQCEKHVETLSIQMVFQ